MNPTPSSTATQMLDSGWRAAAYCLHPRVIGWSLLPFAIAAVLSFVLMFFFWEPMAGAVRAQLEHWLLVDAMLQWLDKLGLSNLRSMLSLLIVMALVLPLVMAFSLVLVAALMSPALARLVAERRFPDLEKKAGGTLIGGLFWALGSAALALLALLISMPFWLIPPIVLVLPPLIWGWLTYRVFAYDVLAVHASADERRELLRAQRWPMLGIGVICGYLGAAPTMVFAFGSMSLALAPLLLPVAIWLYMLVFAFAALWFAHFGLNALQQQRRRTAVPVPAVEILPL